MYPCPACGNLGTDPNGFCLTCGTFVGAPPPPPPARRSPVLLLLIALGVAVLLVAGGLTAVLIARSDRDPQPVASAGPTSGPESSIPGPTIEPTTPAPAPSDPLHDPCVLGKWRETSNQADIQWDGGTVRVTSSGSTQTFRADGTALLDFGAGVTRTGKANGHTYQIVLKGQITFHWQSDRGQILYSNPVGKGTAVYRRDGRQVQSGPLTGGIEPERYTCSGTSLRQFGPDYTIELTRVGPAT